MTYENKAIMFDMDGVLYRGTSGLPRAGDVVDWVRGKGIKVGFITNNSTRTPETFRERLAKYGVMSETDEIITSSIATAEYIRSTFGEGGTAFVIGMEGCREALNGIGIEVVEVDDKRKCDYVVVGMSLDFNYKQLLRAQQEILVNGALFIGTNADRTFPWDDGTVRPGGGTMLAAVVACTYADPVVIGKPELHMIEQMASRYGFKPDDCLMVGDRIDSDILFGNRYGAHTLLVLTGISTREEAEKSDGELKPDYILEDLNGFEDVVEGLWNR